MAHTTMPSDALCHYHQYYQNYEQLIAKTINYITRLRLAVRIPNSSVNTSPCYTTYTPANTLLFQEANQLKSHPPTCPQPEQKTFFGDSSVPEGFAIKMVSLL